MAMSSEMEVDVLLGLFHRRSECLQREANASLSLVETLLSGWSLAKALQIRQRGHCCATLGAVSFDHAAGSTAGGPRGCWASKS